jgi:hypothetical protein
MYSFALHVEDSAGALVAQVDQSLPEAAFTCRPVSLHLTDLPPGTFTLRAVIYEWQTGTRLPVPDDDRPILGTFEVAPP